MRLIIAFTPGSSTDIVGRAVAAKLQEFWGQPVVAENRVGAGGSIGSAVAVKSAPDGYTLLANSSAHVANPGIYASLPYDTLKDFTNLAPLAGGPNVLFVGADSGMKTFADFIAAAKAKPGQLNFSSAGIGSGTHFNLEKLKLMAGIDVPGMPADIVDKINKDVNRALASSDLNDRLVSLGTLPMSMSSAEFTEFVRREVDDTARVLKAAGIKPQ